VQLKTVLSDISCKLHLADRIRNKLNVISAKENSNIQTNVRLIVHDSNPTEGASSDINKAEWVINLTVAPPWDFSST